MLDWIERENRSLVIGISGHGAAGKTTFTEQLVERLPFDVNVLNTDPYIVSSDIRKYTMMPYTYEGVAYTSKMTACHPAAHFIPALERDIAMLHNGLDVMTIDAHYAPSERLHRKHRITIVEGMSVAFAHADLFDVRLYFYTDSETEFHRRASRDITERGMKLDYLKASHNDRRMQYELFMHPYSEQFDVVVKSTIAQPWIVEKNTLV